MKKAKRNPAKRNPAKRVQVRKPKLGDSLILRSTWISSFKWTGSPVSSSGKPLGQVFFLGPDDANQVQKLVSQLGLSWHKEEYIQPGRDLIYFQGAQGPVWILRPRMKAAGTEGSFTAESQYAMARDLCGAMVAQLRAHHLKVVAFEFIGTEARTIQGALVGLELGSYQFRNHFEGKSSGLPEMYIKVSQSPWNYEQERLQIRLFEQEAMAINLARHWVNLPPDILHPEGFVKAAQSLKWSPGTTLEAWQGSRLVKERMNLLLAVGQGAENPPCFLHIRYRPKQKGKRIKPFAFVGKGITFDTGGLDLKPSAGMRLMKKDMGGAAAILALAYWVSATRYPLPCDFYLCLAENGIDGKSMHPGDLICSRAGHWVEIDNTDAEGRLVLADGLDVAVTQKETPELVINVATLTGAIKVALGAEVAGLFSNDDSLASELYQAGLRAGDYNWRMPLVEKYFSSLNSPFADFKNSADGFGGAITAGLFLQKFVGDSTWAHLDIYAWSDKVHGALAQAGGNGQGVQCLIEFLKHKADLV